MPQPNSSLIRIRGSLIALALAVNAPSVAVAQSLGGGGMGSRHGDMGSPQMQRVVDPHTMDLIRAADPNNPVALILAARSDLNLSDSEVTALNGVQMELRGSQAAGRTALDTLGPNEPISSINFATLTPADREAFIEHRKAVAAANAQLHDAAIVARQHALAILTPDQQRRFINLENRVRTERENPRDTVEKSH